MYRVRLDDCGRQELKRRTHDPDLAARTRDRLEMVRLSDGGWSIPKISAHLQVHEQTVRRWIKVFLLKGFDGLADAAHTGRQSAITDEILCEVSDWVTKDARVWSAGAIAEEVARVHGIRRSVDQWRRLLHRHRLGYKRTSRSLHHKQDAEQVAEKKQELEALRKRGTPKRSTSVLKMKPASR